MLLLFDILNRRDRDVIDSPKMRHNGSKLTMHVILKLRLFEKWKAILGRKYEMGPKS
jgi:hypothetical protein